MFETQLCKLRGVIRQARAHRAFFVLYSTIQCGVRVLQTSDIVVATQFREPKRQAVRACFRQRVIPLIAIPLEACIRIERLIETGRLTLASLPQS